MITSDVINLKLLINDPEIDARKANDYRTEYNCITTDDFFKYGRNAYDRERILYDILQAEAFNMHGVNLYYYKTTFDTSSANRIFGEDNNRSITHALSIMAYYDLPKEEEIWTKFGIEGMDNFHIFISKCHFKRVSTLSFGSEYLPIEGDLLGARYGHSLLYEIIDVKDSEEEFLQGKHSWDIIIRPLKDEKMNVGNSLIGDIINTTENQDDILNIAKVVDDSKTDILYVPRPTEQAPKDPFGGW